MGVGDGEGTDVLVAVPAVVMTHEIGQSEVHQGKVVATLGERGDRGVGRTSILVGVVAAVDHEPMLRRVSLDNGVERRPVHEHRRGATGSTTGFQKDGASELSGIGVLSSTPWVAGSMPRNMVV